MVDALVSGASVERRAGSSPVLGTMTKLQVIDINYLQFLLSSRINAASTDLVTTGQRIFPVHGNFSGKQLT